MTFNLTPPARADRARRTAAVGAYRKATTELVSSMPFQEEEDLTWAKELLPTSSGRTALQRPRAGTSTAPPR